MTIKNTLNLKVLAVYAIPRSSKGEDSRKQIDFLKVEKGQVENGGLFQNNVTI